VSDTPITVYKHDHKGHETWHYSGRVLVRGPNWVQIEARFNRPDRDLGYVIFRENDRFIEWFFSDRWFNIFEVHDVDDDHLKGWYCNITRPAALASDAIRADDLALDLWVHPDGRLLVLDQDEFNALSIDDTTRARALEGLAALQRMVVLLDPPFHLIRG
jgi:protein associated with RNAse G/E